MGLGVFFAIFALAISGIFGPISLLSSDLAAGFKILYFSLGAYFWLVGLAALFIWSPARHGMLRKQMLQNTYAPFYHRVMSWLLRATMRWVGQTPMEGDTRGFWRLFWDSLTHRLFDRALLVAVVYPSLLIFIHWWWTGEDGRIGGLVVFEREEQDWARGVTLGMIAFVLFFRPVVFAAAASPQRFLRSAAGWLIASDRRMLIAVAGAGAVVGAVVGAVAGAVAGAGAAAGAVAGAVVGAVLGAVAGAVVGAVAGAAAVAVAVAVVGAGAVVGAVAGVVAVVGAVAGAVVVAGAVAAAGAGAVAAAGAVAIVGVVAVLVVGVVEVLVSRQKTAIASIFLIATLTMSLAFCFAVLPWDAVPEEARAFFLFLAVLPILNAVFDTVSYAVTLALTQRGLRLGAVAFLLGVLDFIIAGALFLGLGAALIAAIAAMNALSGVVFVDPVQLIGGLYDWQQNWWLYAMLFSTILPTGLHFLVASFSLSSVVPISWRRWMMGSIEDAEDSEDRLSSTLAPFALGALWFLAFAAPIALIAGLIWLVWNCLADLAEDYQHWLTWVAGFIGAL